VSDNADDEFLAEWDAADAEDDEFLAELDAAEAEALAELRAVLGELPKRDRPEAELRAACDRLRSTMKRHGWPGELLAACGGLDARDLPSDDAELWLTLASGIVAPREDLPDDAEGDDEPDEPDEPDEFGEFGELTADEQAMVALCALDYIDWLAVTSALARGGPGTPAAADDLARYVSEYDADDIDDQADAAAGMFQSAVALWEVLGAVDEADRLTSLGWWGLPEAAARAWTPRQ
jgi:hypothetical protein